MTIRVRVLTLLLSVFFAPALAQAADGILITQRVTSTGPALTIRMQLEPARMRTEVAGPNGEVANITIFDGNKQVLFVVNPAQKTYMEMTKADIERLSAQLQAVMAQMKSQLDKLPPAQRAQMEALMKGGGTPQLTRTGSDKVGKWTCNKHDMTLDGQKIGETCSVDPSVLGFTAADFAVMRQISTFYASMAPQVAGRLPGVSGLDPTGSADFPVRTVMMLPGQTTTTEVVEAVRQTFPDSLFVVPAGFAKQDLAAMLGGLQPGR